MLGLGIESTQFPSPLWIFDNKHSLDFDGSTEAIKIQRHSSMITNSFTIGIWVGDSEAEWDQSSADNAIFGNMDASGFHIFHGYKRIGFSCFVQDPTDETAYEKVVCQTTYNKMSYALGAGYGASTNFSTGDGGWNLLVGTFDEGEMKLYIGGGVHNDGNGMGNDLHLVDTQTPAGGGTWNEVSYGAKSYSDDVHFGIAAAFLNVHETMSINANIQVDNAFFFNSALPHNVLKTIYNNGEGIDMMAATTGLGGGDDYTTTHISYLKCHLRMEEGTGGDGDTIFDTSGNNNSGEIVGSPTWSDATPERITA